MELGLKVTVNSDDPAYFGGQVNQNFIEIQQALNLSKEDIYTLARNSFEFSLMADDQKKICLNELESFYKSNS